MDQKEPSQAGEGRQPAAGNGTAAKPDVLPDTSARTKALYDQLFPPESPRRKFGPFVLVAAVLVVLLLGKCAVSSVGDKISAASQARAEAKRVRTTGVLVVKSNRPEATVAATRLASADDPSTDVVKGTPGQALSGLTPGRYTVTLHADGWPDAHGEVDVPAGQQTEATINFRTGSLRLESDPAGAVVKLAGALLGKTPLVVPQLPPGEVQFSVEYPSWPAVTVRTTITENAEATESVRLPQGRLIVESTPAGATVLMGGLNYGRTPLLFEHLPVGVTQLTLQAKDFPPMETAVTVADRDELKIHLVLGTVFPVLDPAELLRDVWVSNEQKRGPVFNATTGIYRPKNDIVKNLFRETLYKNWLRKSYRYSGPVKSYDAASGRLEFAEQKSELSRYRVTAQVTPGGSPIAKDATVALYGRLTAVEEPAWPARVITLELEAAEFLPESTP